MTAADTRGMQVLGRETCLQLLRDSVLGRVAISHRALPIILPINYAMYGDDIVFAVGPGVLLHAAQHRDVVCFEADYADPTADLAWSVVVNGPLRCIDGADPVHQLDAQPNLARWAAGAPPTFVGLQPVIITGRHTPQPPRPADTANGRRRHRRERGSCNDG